MPTPKTHVHASLFAKTGFLILFQVNYVNTSHTLTRIDSWISVITLIYCIRVG